jgi:phage antirepressor YoqD-like protein
MARALIEASKEIEEKDKKIEGQKLLISVQENKIDIQKAQISYLEPKADAWHTFLDSKGLLNLTSFGKMIMKPHAFIKWLRDNNICYKWKKGSPNLPYQEFINKGYFIIKFVKVKGHDRQQTFITHKGVDFVYNKLKGFEQEDDFKFVPLDSVLYEADPNECNDYDADDDFYIGNDDDN